MVKPESHGPVLLADDYQNLKLFFGELNAGDC